MNRDDSPNVGPEISDADALQAVPGDKFPFKAALCDQLRAGRAARPRLPEGS